MNVSYPHDLSCQWPYCLNWNVDSNNPLEVSESDLRERKRPEMVVDSHNWCVSELSPRLMDDYSMCIISMTTVVDCDWLQLLPPGQVSSSSGSVLGTAPLASVPCCWRRHTFMTGACLLKSEKHFRLYTSMSCIFSSINLNLLESLVSPHYVVRRRREIKKTPLLYFVLCPIYTRKQTEERRKVPFFFLFFWEIQYHFLFISNYQYYKNGLI